MRTSALQFQLLVEYMERNGDLSKPTEGPQGRATNTQRWAELAALLNADATGDTKTVEKWRKVWSDFKNNAKKKAGRIYRDAQGTGGGPACNLKLSDLEQRALSIVGTQAATGILEIPEIGLEEIIVPPPPTASNVIPMQETFPTEEDWNRPGTSSQSTPFMPMCEQSLAGTRAPEARGPPTPIQLETAQHVVDSAPPASARRRMLQSPTPLPRTPRRRRRGENPRSPMHRRTRTQTQSELARQAFARSDCEWRAFQQETERERIRLREAELAMQQQWLGMFGQFLALGNRFADILEKK